MMLYGIAISGVPIARLRRVVAANGTHHTERRLPAYEAPSLLKIGISNSPMDRVRALCLSVAHLVPGAHAYPAFFVPGNRDVEQRVLREFMLRGRRLSLPGFSSELLDATVGDAIDQTMLVAA